MDVNGADRQAIMRSLREAESGQIDLGHGDGEHDWKQIHDLIYKEGEYGQRKRDHVLA